MVPGIFYLWFSNTPVFKNIKLLPKILFHLLKDDYRVWFGIEDLRFRVWGCRSGFGV